MNARFLPFTLSLLPLHLYIRGTLGEGQKNLKFAKLNSTLHSNCIMGCKYSKII